MIIPERGSNRTGIVVVYDLRDPMAWERARQDRKLWGQARSETHALETYHIATGFKPGGALKETT